MEVSQGIERFKGVSNCYLVVDVETFMVDTGLPGNSGNILNYLKNTLKIDPHEVKTIVITHHHFDHTGSLDKLKVLTGAKVAIHRDDAEYLTGGNQAGSAFMVPIVKLMKFIYRTKDVQPDIILNEGDQIGNYRVIHTPGHTPGSICLYNPKNKVIFVGDNLRYSNEKLEAPSSRLLPEPEQYKKSMLKLKDLDIEVILTGHGEPVTVEANKKIDEFLKSLE